MRGALPRWPPRRHLKIYPRAEKWPFVIPAEGSSRMMIVCIGTGRTRLDISGVTAVQKSSIRRQRSSSTRISLLGTMCVLVILVMPTSKQKDNLNYIIVWIIMALALITVQMLSLKKRFQLNILVSIDQLLHPSLNSLFIIDSPQCRRALFRNQAYRRQHLDQFR
jgi:hypothetical protein